MSFTNSADFLRPTARPPLQSLDDWIAACQVGGLSIKRAAAVVEVHSTTKPSNYFNKPIKTFSNPTVAVLKREQSVVHQATPKILPQNPLSFPKMFKLSLLQDRKILKAMDELRKQRDDDDRNHFYREDLTELKSLKRELKNIHEDQMLIKESLRQIKLMNSSDSFCSPPSSFTIRERVEFDKCFQLADESFEEYFRRLNKFASKAKLCSCCVDQQMSTRIAMGLRDLNLRRELQELSPFPSLWNVVQICRKKEEIYALMNKESCTACGQPKHSAKRGCPAVDILCNLCKNYGHYFIMCPLNSKFAKNKAISYDLD